MAIREYQQSLDSNGIPYELATSPEADPNPSSPQRNPVRFFPKGPFVNFAEKARLDAEDAYKKAGEDVNMNGLFWTVEEKSFAANPDA